MRAVPAVRLARMGAAILLLWPLPSFHVALVTLVSAVGVEGCATGQRLARAADPPARRVALPI